MDKEDFVIKLKQYGLNDLVKDYREQIAAKVKEEDSSFLKFFKEYYQNSDAQNKEETIIYLKEVITSGMMIFIGLLDGVSNINQEGIFKLIYEEEGEEPYLVNNREEDDLLTLWYEDVED